MLRIVFPLLALAAAKTGGRLVITEMQGSPEPVDVIGSERSVTDCDARCGQCC